MIRALRDIASGEELTIAYVDVAHPLQQRQELLRSQYHFTCDCPYCVAEARYVPGLLMGRLSPQATKAAIIHAITTIFQYFVVDPEAAVADRCAAGAHGLLAGWWLGGGIDGRCAFHTRRIFRPQLCESAAARMGRGPAPTLATRSHGGRAAGLCPPADPRGRRPRFADRVAPIPFRKSCVLMQRPPVCNTRCNLQTMWHRHGWTS